MKTSVPDPTAVFTDNDLTTFLKTQIMMTFFSGPLLKKMSCLGDAAALAVKLYTPIRRPKAYSFSLSLLLEVSPGTQTSTSQNLASQNPVRLEIPFPSGLDDPLWQCRWWGVA